MLKCILFQEVRTFVIYHEITHEKGVNRPMTRCLVILAENKD